MTAPEPAARVIDTRPAALDREWGADFAPPIPGTVRERSTTLRWYDYAAVLVLAGAVVIELAYRLH